MLLLRSKTSTGLVSFDCRARHCLQVELKQALKVLAAFPMYIVVVVAFSLRARILGECSTIYSPPVLFFFFFFKVEISAYTLIPLFRPGSVHSGAAS